MNVILKQEIEAYVDSHRQEMLDLWRDITNFQGHTEDLDALKHVVDRFKAEFEAAGLTCKLLPQGNKTQDYLVGEWGSENPGKPILFSGHYDTIMKPGSYPDNPFKIVGGKAFGPGVLDMRGGIIISLYVIKALIACGYKESPLRICYVSDEESCHEYNDNAGKVIMDSAKGCICAFNMETGRVNNDLCIGRSARVGFDVTVTGVATHAGNDFAGGRNAIAEMCHKVLEFEALTNLELGSTVNCGVINGGTVANAIPGKCELNIDMRFLKQSELEKTVAAAEEICKKTFIDGTHTTYSYRVAMPAFETIPGVMELYTLANDVAKAYGYAETGKIVLGGVSDASYLTMAGIPTLCSTGVRGEDNHTTKEYAVVESMFERTKWLAAICLNLGDFKF